MSQSDSEIKIIPPRVVSRDFEVRELSSEIRRYTESGDVTAVGIGTDVQGASGEKEAEKKFSNHPHESWHSKSHEALTDNGSQDIFENQKSARRDFFKALIPASGKLLTTLFREVGTTISVAVEDAKYGAKTKSD